MTHFDAEYLEAYYREPYRMLNPPPTPISPEETLLKTKDGSIYTAFGDVSGGRVGYRNKHGGFCPNFALPAKQAIHGWLSLDGFIFGCEPLGHWRMAQKIWCGLEHEEGAGGYDCEYLLEEEGWVKLRGVCHFHLKEPTEIQASVLLALMGD